MPVVEIPFASIFVIPGPDINRRIVCTVKHQDFTGWYDPKGQIINGADSSERLYVEDNVEHALVIKGITYLDGGVYTCRGSVNSDTFELLVECKH